MIELSMAQVVLAVVPVTVAVLIYGRVVDDWTSVLWATLRMFTQLLAIGYGLAIIFGLDSPGWVLLVIAIMMFGAGWISLRPVRKHKVAYWPIFVSIGVTSLLNLFWIMAFVIQPDPWYSPSVIIPLAGMVISNAMNSVSLCVERYYSECSDGKAVAQARKNALSAAMIPQINSLMAVGLVSLPGMMTGQILSGVSPMIAVRYQIVIMSMILSNSALGSFLYLALQSKGSGESG
ncbi:MAG: ABC transporter permease [Reinekea sp.]|jgi:putative ABC transport system permease protein